jgi:predicted RNase H-like nuclease (RuvC/YqgF family)
MRHYFTLHLRADQARTLMHTQLQQNRYMDVVHGPPYERVEHWSRCLALAKLEFEDVEKRYRGGVVGVEEVREKKEQLEGLLAEISDGGR